MNTSASDPFAELPAWTPPAEFLQLKEPAHQALAKFVHGCSDDEATRTAATTALVLSLWQLLGRKLTSEVPTLLLVRPEQAEEGPRRQPHDGGYEKGDRDNRECFTFSHFRPLVE